LVVELFSPGHFIPLLIIAALVFFGWKQLPDMARSAGKSLRVFRTEIKGLADDDAARETKSALTAPLSADVPPPPPTPAGAAGSWAWQPAQPAQPAESAAQPPVAERPASAPADAVNSDAAAKPAG
jgi:sec-independent protein translocase protein TatA